MARNRILKSSFWESDEIADVSPLARLLFLGIVAHADDQGSHPDSPKKLKRSIFPGDDISANAVAEMVNELLGVKLLSRYEAEGDRYIHVVKFTKHNYIQKPSFIYPPPPGAPDLRKSNRRATSEYDTGMIPATSEHDAGMISGRPPLFPPHTPPLSPPRSEEKRREENTPQTPHGGAGVNSVEFQNSAEAFLNAFYRVCLGDTTHKSSRKEIELTRGLRAICEDVFVDPAAADRLFAKIKTKLKAEFPDCRRFAGALPIVRAAIESLAKRRAKEAETESAAKRRARAAEAESRRAQRDRIATQKFCQLWTELDDKTKSEIRARAIPVGSPIANKPDDDPVVMVMLRLEYEKGAARE